MKLLSLLAIACNKAYKDKTFEQGDVECLYQRLGDKHVYAFRGTETQLVTRGGFWDLLRSLFFVREEDKHSGYLDGWDSIKDDVLRHYEQQPPGPLYLTGHSLGGAIALVGTAELLERGFDPDGLACVTFGAPRAMDLDKYQCRESLAKCAMEVVHAKDPIPSTFKFAGFDYADRPYYVGGDIRAPWYKRRMKFHNIGTYYTEIVKKGH